MPAGGDLEEGAAAASGHDDGRAGRQIRSRCEPRDVADSHLAATVDDRLLDDAWLADRPLAEPVGGALAQQMAIEPATGQQSNNSGDDEYAKLRHQGGDDER